MSHFLEEQDVKGWSHVERYYRQAFENLALKFNRAELLAFLECDRTMVNAVTVEKFQLLAELELGKCEDGDYAAFFRKHKIVSSGYGVLSPGRLFCVAVCLLHEAGVRTDMTPAQVELQLQFARK